jgi:type IV secretion system protein VirB10
MTDAPAAHRPAKVDPETLALRERPARPIRFRRGVLIGAAALASVGLWASPGWR